MNERDAILAYADAQYPVYRQMALDIHARPETSNHEYFACGLLAGQLRKEGFVIKEGRLNNCRYYRILRIPA